MDQGLKSLPIHFFYLLFAIEVIAACEGITWAIGLNDVQV
jgi:hypothetical protein